MNDFVNPNQRGVSLPPGCKDLMDVLKPRGAAAQEGNVKSAGVVEQWGSTGSLKDLPGRVATVDLHRAANCTLTVGTAEVALLLILHRSEGIGLHLSFWLEPDVDREKLVRDLIQRHGIIPIIAGDPLADGERTVNFYSLRVARGQAAEVMGDFLRIVLGVTEETVVKYRFMAVG
jgi:hypothetical protein